jgi:hypothetical protein
MTGYVPTLAEFHAALAPYAEIILIVSALLIIALHFRNTEMLDNLKALIVKVQALTEGLMAMAASLASITAERDSLKAELDALKASLGDLPQVETDLGAAIDHALTLIPAPAPAA